MVEKNQPSEFTCNVMNLIDKVRNLDSEVTLVQDTLNQLAKVDTIIFSVDTRSATKDYRNQLEYHLEQIRAVRKGHMDRLDAYLENQNAKTIKAENSIISQIEKGNN